MISNIPSSNTNNSIDLSLFFPPSVKSDVGIHDLSGNSYYGIDDLYAMVYYIGSYYNALNNDEKELGDKKIEINNNNYLTVYSEIKNKLIRYYTKDSNKLNPYFNLVQKNNTCKIKKIFRQSGTNVDIGNFVGTEFDEILESGTYSFAKFQLGNEGTLVSLIEDNYITDKDKEIKITGCDVNNINNLKDNDAKKDKKDKIQPFSKKKSEILFYFPPEGGVTIDQKNLLSNVKKHLNRGVPLKVTLLYQKEMDGPNTFSRIFSTGYPKSSPTEKHNNPFNIDPKFIVTNKSFDTTKKFEIIHYAAVIAGYFDYDVEADRSTGVLKIVTTMGPEVGLNGCVYISYNYFFKSIYEGGMLTQITAFE